ncbi:MAG: nucleotidyltransferase domain-containing protein [Gemmatimonadota bacterium]|nr:nucleotidyltransferase domain-containing protein [Gemmatimonadota bacterium]
MPDQIIEELWQIKDSIARGDMTRNSDVDLLLIGDGGKRTENQSFIVQ